MKQVRWKCERCENGLLASIKPRRDDVRRYCLPCSAETGKLVERVSPSLEAQRAKKVEQRKEASKRKRQTVARKRESTKPVDDIKKRASKFGSNSMPIQKELDRLWKLAEPYHQNNKAKPSVRIDWSRSTIRDGRVWTSSSRLGVASHMYNRITLKPFESWGTLAHEVCHIAIGYRRSDTGRAQSHDEVFYKALKDLYQRRWKRQMNWSAVTRFGYEVDSIMESQIGDLVDRAWKKGV